MVLALASVLANPDTQKTLIAGFAVVAQSAPVIAAVGIAALAVSWNLEHIAYNSDTKKFVRLSTIDTSNLADRNLTPIMPPIQSMVARAADAPIDVIEATAALATKQIEVTGQKGLIQGVLEFIFGG